MKTSSIKLVTILCTVISLSGCVTPVNKTPTPVGGSRADGTVTLSYQYGALEKPIVNWDEAQAAAEKRCIAWDYKKAEPFGGAQSTCLAFNGYGTCLQWQVNSVYQCLELQEKVRKKK